MINNIEVNVPKGIGNVLASQIEAVAQDSISKTLIATKAKWERTAQQRLKTTRSDYLFGLNTDNAVTFPDAYTGVLTLQGGWPGMLEEGYGPYDMKTGFGKSDKRKPLKDGSGWYMTIPMRHRTPGTSGAVGGAPMPEDIYSQAKALRGGQRLTDTQQNYPPGQSWTGYNHRNGIYEGMRRAEKQYQRAKQGKYQTFRRVSSKSDPASWMHPGFPGIHALDVVRPFAQRTLDRTLANAFRDVMN